MEILKKIWDVLIEAWEFTLYSSGDTSVQLNQLIIALVIVIAGSLLAKRVAGIAGDRLKRTARLSGGTAFFLQKALYYLLLIIAVLVALPIAGIPITIFTVLGGAVAIGVGFGAQNLFNNLISGLIIMIEKPIRLNDIVEVNGELGRIMDIGNRCIRLRRVDGIDVLLPNSHFLQEPVVNWTLHDAVIRGDVSVGVAYGSPTQKVKELILKAAFEHPQVLDDPEPQVLFSDFGDSALVFDLLFWSRVVKPLDRRILASDLRYRIDDLFRENDIVIAFPQLDVHFDKALAKNGQ